MKPGRAYDLTAEATQQDGKALTGVVQTKVPNPILTIVLRDDLPPRAGGPPASRGQGDVFPPPPRPNDKVGEYVPPTPTPPKPPADGGWGPGGSVTGVPPPSIGAPRPPVSSGAGAPIPPPDNLDDLSVPPGTKPTKPENVADGPKTPFKPPPTTIPGPGGMPPVPPLPVLPPSFGPTGGGRSAMGTTTGATGKLALVDALERPWDLDSVRPGGLVLVEFMTTTCVPCKRSIPTW